MADNKARAEKKNKIDRLIKSLSVSVIDGTAQRIHELIMSFKKGHVDVVDIETGDLFNPNDYNEVTISLSYIKLILRGLFVGA